MSALTKRERWLVIEGFLAGHRDASGAPPGWRIIEQAAAWLDSSVADGVTVGMALAQEADRHDADGDC